VLLETSLKGFNTGPRRTKTMLRAILQTVQRTACVWPHVGVLAYVFASAAHAGAGELDHHRPNVKNQRLTTMVIVGSVLKALGDNRIVTSISAPELRKYRIAALDLVKVKLGTQTLVARIMDRDGYRRLRQNSALREQMDVDVLCVMSAFDNAATLEIVGLGGGLVPWLNPKTGTAVSIEKSEY
jgi:hypothetical protein